MSGMKFFAAIAILLFTVMGFAAQALAQGPVRGPVEAPRDPVMETTAKHNLQVARWYLTKRKAYEGARDRLQEILDTYPEFSRIDEVIYLMGEAHVKMGKNDAAADYYNKLLKEYPESQFAKKARERLDELKTEKNVKSEI